jgi:hypothetical protein
MDIENHNDVEVPVYIENPMNVVSVPVAQVVGIEVMGEVLVESRPKLQPQRQPQSEQSEQSQLGFNEKINYYISTCVALSCMLSILGGLILFMIWFCNPRALGDTND